jgi:hypothetical protein
MAGIDDGCHWPVKFIESNILSISKSSSIIDKNKKQLIYQSRKQKQLIKLINHTKIWDQQKNKHWFLLRCYVYSIWNILLYFYTRITYVRLRKKQMTNIIFFMYFTGPVFCLSITTSFYFKQSKLTVKKRKKKHSFLFVTLYRCRCFYFSSP